ncbi:CD276 antigen-like [Erpetoichthys calabaricus]|uniref:CD276 antigen-like n=1 Tax=Erpetoichthys calabaricus TaxID=27687 RepID=A0A8C4STP6_ERPCA|nr:CD276 antigen-like [Erpetoichthys calabaricus]
MATCIKFTFILMTVVTLAGRSSGFAVLECASEVDGTFGKDTVLNCTIRFNGNIEVSKVIWKKKGFTDSTDVLLLQYDIENAPNSGESRVQFATSFWKERGDLSLRLSNTHIFDEGTYTCIVACNAGIEKKEIRLRVTAPYTDIKVVSQPEKDIKDDTRVRLTCRASLGYPEAIIEWKDSFEGSWTKSAETNSERSEDGRFSIVSILELRASYDSPTYSCILKDPSGKVLTEEYTLPFEPLKSTDHQNKNIMTAIFIVIAALVIGIIVLFLMRMRRRWRWSRHSVKEYNPEEQKFPTMMEKEQI